MIKILIGPSGSGKTSIAEVLVKDYGYSKPITCTTRKPRGGEIDGVDYHFLTQEDFVKQFSEGKFVERTIYSGNFYGLRFQDLDPSKDIVLVMDINGAKAIKSRYPEARSYFISRPKKDIIKSILKRECSLDEKTERIYQLDKDFEVMNQCNVEIKNDDIYVSAESINED